MNHLQANPAEGGAAHHGRIPLPGRPGEEPAAAAAGRRHGPGQDGPPARTTGRLHRLPLSARLQGRNSITQLT